MFLSGRHWVLCPNWLAQALVQLEGLPVWEQPDGTWPPACTVTTTLQSGARGQSELLPRVCENNTNAPKGYDMEDTVTSGINEHKIIDSGVFLPPSFE